MKVFITIFAALMLTGCVQTVAKVAVGTTKAVVKVPIVIGKTAVDVVTPDGDKKEKKEKDD